MNTDLNRLLNRLALLTILAGLVPTVFGVDDPKSFFPDELIAPLPPGVLGRPFGESVVVQGKVIEGPFKFESSATEGRLLVQRVNGVATQQGVVIRFDPVTPKELMDGFSDGEGKVREDRLEKMLGKTFEMRGFEKGEHEGMTGEQAAIQDDVQSREFHYHLYFQPLMMKSIPEVHFAPADFSQRVAELRTSGSLRSQGI